MHRVDLMTIANAREFFATLASRGREPRLADTTGTWQFEVDGLGTWSVKVDRSAFNVAEGPQSDVTAASFRISEEELVRLANGGGHENLLTALLRGVIHLNGQLRFAQKLWTIVPFPQGWS
jgi:hypothetical protein